MNEDGFEDDEAFLSLVDALEADVVKRRRMTQSLSASSTASSAPNNNNNNPVEEGKYMAALRGSNSYVWQHAYSNPINKRPLPQYGGLASASTGTSVVCYKCQQAGHWARDCVATNPAGGGGRAREGGGDEDVPEKQCPCGGGPCIVLTSTTEKNPGRKFYKCPIREGEGSCNFFKWCDEVNSIRNTSPFAVQSFSSRYDSTLGNSGRTGPSPCYKCGMDGHWAKDCPKSSSSMSWSSSTGQGDRSTCFKCGQAGHWAKDCSNQSSNSAFIGGKSSNSPHN